MAKGTLDELADFLQPESRIDLKHISLGHLLGLTASEDGVKTILSNERIVLGILGLTEDKVEEIAKNALLILINLTSSPEASAELLKYRTNRNKNLLELFIGYVLDPQKKDADAACMILANVTRLENELSVCLNTIIPFLNDILNVFVNVEFNKKGASLNYLAPMFSNLSRSTKVQKWFIEENPHVPLIKLLPFCNYQPSNIRRGGAIGVVRNLTFDTNNHEFLLNPDLDLLTYLLNPLAGNEEYEDEEMDKLPIALQYLPKEKTREPDLDVRIMILETFNKLCSTKNGRETLRDNGVYYILREYHKWEKDPKALLACENVVDILIQKEDEVGAEDLSAVEIPDHVKDTLKKMDDDYLSSFDKN